MSAILINVIIGVTSGFVSAIVATLCVKRSSSTQKHNQNQNQDTSTKAHVGNQSINNTFTISVDRIPFKRRRQYVNVKKFEKTSSSIFDEGEIPKPVHHSMTMDELRNHVDNIV